MNKAAEPLSHDHRVPPYGYPAFLWHLLKYRLPLPVRELKVFVSGDSYYVCPRCRQSLDREYLAYCCCCGQHLHWHRCRLAEVVFISEP